jgi:CrcB protein
MTWLAVAIGGALGSVARHAMNGAVPARADGFPTGIFLINVLGCLAIGCLAGLIAASRVQMSSGTRTFLFAGVLGGFTTFSTYGLDTFLLARSGHGGLAVLNAAGQIAIGFAAVWAGYAIASWRP